MTRNASSNAGSTSPARCLRALVLMGGGARTAYQVGVLWGLATMLARCRKRPPVFPFEILVGTSAGALNAACLAGRAESGLRAFGRLAQFWGRLRSSDVYTLDISRLARESRLIAALYLSRQARRAGAILDTMPLVNTLHHAVSLVGVEQALQKGALRVLAVTASSYTSGEHWTFCHMARDARAEAWRRPGRRASFQPITIEHLMASSALPFLFPATPLWVDGRCEYFGDGSMRQTSPLSPAIHLGAHKVFVIGVGQPRQTGFESVEPATRASRREYSDGPPTLGSIAGHAMASVFHDTLQADIEQARRVSQTLRQLPPEMAAMLPYRKVEVLDLNPSRSLDALALEHLHELPASTRDALQGFGGLSGGAGLASYLLFEPGFVQALIALGEHDACAREAELLAFFEDA